MRSIKSQGHEASADETGNGNSHDPGEEQEAESLPVDGLEGTVAETNTNSCAGDAHGSRDGESILREDEDGDGGTHLHG